MKIRVPVTCLLALTSLTAQAQSARVLADKIVGIVGDKIVLRSDIANYIEDMRRQGQEPPANAECILLQSMMADKALVLQAEKDSLPVSDEEIEAELDRRVRYFVQKYGGKEAFEQIAGRTVYQVKEDFRTSIKEGNLATAMRKKIVENVKITPVETKAFYDRIPKDSLRFYETELVVGEIVLYPKAGRELEKFAIDELVDYKKQAESGRNFESLARLYSEDPSVKQNGGRFEVNKNEKTWDPDWKNACFRLKEGQVSPVIKSKFGYHIIQLISRNGDDAVVRHILRIPQVTDEDVSVGKARLDSVRAKLIAGTLSFGEAVDKYHGWFQAYEDDIQLDDWDHEQESERRAMRRMHGSYRWKGRAFLLAPGERSRQQKDHHDRRSRGQRQTASGAGCVPGTSRAAVRLLYARHDHDGRGHAAADSKARRSDDPPRTRRQHLPLHGLSGHRRGDHGRQRQDGESVRRAPCTISTIIAPPTPLPPSRK